MKSLGKIILAIIAILIIAMFTIPLFFADKIEEAVKKEANENLNATLEIGDISISMFKSFPNLNVEIKNLIITGKDVFAKDTLAKIETIGAGVNLASLISGDQIKTKGIYVTNAHFNTIIKEDEKANWDIMKPQSGKSDGELTDGDNSSMPDIAFDKILLNNINLSFNDLKNNTLFKSENINIAVSGNFSQDNTNIDLKMDSERTDLKYGGISYLNDTRISFNTAVNADLKEKKFTLKKNSLKINELTFLVTGLFDLNKDDTYIDLKIDSHNNNFKSILSMIPGEFRKDIKNLETDGQLSLNTVIKGNFKENHLPAFTAQLKVDNARLKYPELKESIEDINIDVQISNKGGDPDNTVTDISKMQFKIANNPFDFKLSVKHPVSDPELDGYLKGIIDLDKVKNTIPMKGISIGGVINAEAVFNGKMSYIEKEEYERFIAKGGATLNKFSFATTDFPKAINIAYSDFSFSSKRISLKKLQGNIGRSDFSANGNIENFFPYIFKDQKLKGDFQINSGKLDINELLATTNNSKGNNTNNDTESGVVEIPDNLNINIIANIKSILYDKLIISNTSGRIAVNNSRANLSNLKMSLLKGEIVMNGAYYAASGKSPRMNIDFDINKLDIKSAWKSFTIIKKTVPIAMSAEGSISANMSLTSVFDDKMEIIPSSMNGNGKISSRGIKLNENKMLDALAKMANDNSFKRVSISKLDINFLIKDGNIQVKPFKTKIAGYPATIYGQQDVKGNIDYTISGKVDKKVIGKDLLHTFEKIPGFNNIDTFDVDLMIGGTLSNPKVKPNLDKARKQIQKAALKEIKNKTKDELIKGFKKLFR